MCKVFPGPRCAAHTRSRLREAQQKTRLLREQYAEILISSQAAVMNPEMSSREQIIAKSQLEQVASDLRLALESEAHAQLMYDSTPTGQQWLAREIELSTDSHEKSALKERLDRAVGERQHQEQLFRVLREADEEDSWKDLQSVQVLEGNIRRLRESTGKLEQQIPLAEKRFRETEAIAATIQGSTSRALRKVQDAQDEMRARLASLYVSHGVPQDRAKIYADDSIREQQSGWMYPTENSYDRLPVFMTEVVVKTKGDSHEDYFATRAVRDTVRQDPSTLGDVHERYMAAVDEYHTSAHELKDAKSSHHAIAGKVESIMQRYSENNTKIADMQNRRDHIVALVRSGLGSRESSPVSFNTWITSFRDNPENIGNAYVRYKPRAWEPVYLRAEQISRDPSNPYILFEGGVKLNPDQVKAQKLLLVR